jgi:hypothetical protein
VTRQRRLALAIALLILSLTGLGLFAQGLRTIDTIVMLTCGLVGGAALAELAALRLRRK